MSAGSGSHSQGASPYSRIVEANLPARPGRILAGAAGICGSLFLATWAYMNWSEKRKLERYPTHPGAIPAWRDRYAQVAAPNRYQGAQSFLRNDSEKKADGPVPLAENSPKMKGQNAAEA
ncbi:uncharacterized protein STEHIDRAFT_138136 [Stereum hirsutum FP-91666 SS1]|uniref:uncharacterized protein n=1 Tax=Stereum hirsutum (strain FP-91666) TaxID=721885 RepID=UPI000440D6BE|nr:uncharacterized protein STEHIDRAFT_138136 [Stereum hirsutum FP-91666 SS1]EIM89030.1 hypothetical protein STEHIDRAFT_138136 [Stereum hirsutum FP-91666 SS1]